MKYHFSKEVGQLVGSLEGIVVFSERCISCLCYDCRGFCVKLWIATRLNCWLSYIILNESNAMVSGIILGYIGSPLFKNYPIRIAEQIHGAAEKAIDAVA